MITKSKRREYFAMHLTKEHRELLKAEAKRRGMSMSALGSSFVTAGLMAAGCVPEPKRVDDSPRFAFEEFP
jgi:hypothetical protein